MDSTEFRITYGQRWGLQKAAQGEEQVQIQEQRLHSPGDQPACAAQFPEGTPGKLGKLDFLVSLGPSPAAWLEHVWDQSSAEIKNSFFCFEIAHIHLISSM